MYDNPGRRLHKAFFGAGIPVTMFLIAANILTFFIGNIARASVPTLSLAFIGSEWLPRFWTLVTWPLVNFDPPFALLFTCLWAYMMCGSLERSWGARTFAGFFVALSALMAFTTWAGGQILHQQVGLAGLRFAIAAPTIAWCALNRREVLNFFGIIPVPAPLLALLTVVIVWYEVGPPLLGLFALSGCAAAYAYVQYGGSSYRGYAGRGGFFGGATQAKTPRPALRMRHFDRESEREAPVSVGLSPVRWWRARRERKKLEALWNRSNPNDPKQDERGNGGRS